MGMNFGNITKVSFQTDIKRKQAFFNRCKRRFKVANTPGEKVFLKGEAGKIVTELKQCSKKWKNFGFGACTWITKSFTVTNFFKEALKTFESKLVDGKVVVENPNRRLAKFAFCKKGELSLLATKRYQEIRKNVDG